MIVAVEFAVGGIIIGVAALSVAGVVAGVVVVVVAVVAVAVRLVIRVQVEMSEGNRNLVLVSIKIHCDNLAGYGINERSEDKGRSCLADWA